MLRSKQRNESTDLDVKEWVISNIFLNYIVTPLQNFKRRTSAVTKNEMDKYWKHLSIMYMTKESDNSDNPNGIVEHKLLWRSKSKLRLCMRL